MSKTIDVSGAPARAFQYALASFVVAGVLVFAAGIVGGLLQSANISVPVPDEPHHVAVIAAVSVALWLSLTALFVRRARSGDGDWWGPVPRDQYLGRFAGYGGLARHSWERAVEQLPDRADEDG